MKSTNILVAGSIVVGHQAVYAVSKTVRVSDLDQNGFNEQLVRDEFRRISGSELTSNEFLKVSAEDEGKELNFETLDHLSFTVPRDSASGVDNKFGDSPRM